MVTLTAGSVVLIRFPFSDLSDSKVRPSLVLADAGDDEWVLCQITSNAYTDARAVPLPAGAFLDGGIQKVGYARPGKLFTAHASLVYSRVGRLKPTSMRLVLEAVINTLSVALTN